MGRNTGSADIYGLRALESVFTLAAEQPEAADFSDSARQILTRVIGLLSAKADAADADIGWFVKTGLTSVSGTAAALDTGWQVWNGDLSATDLLADGGITLATYALTRGKFRPVAAESVPLNTRAALQGVTDRAVADLAANPSLARGLMSEGSYRHLVEGTNLASASYGKAVERLTARHVRADPNLSSILQYQSRPFKSTPDFFGYEGQNLRLLDITTDASQANHLARSYGPYTDYAIHPGLPLNLVFPR